MERQRKINAHEESKIKIERLIDRWILWGFSEDENKKKEEEKESKQKKRQRKRNPREETKVIER